MELEVTWRRVLRVWWAYLWRNLLVLIIAMLVSGMIGGIAGFALAQTGMALQDILLTVMPIGWIVGLGISIVPVKMMLGKSFGDFRLVLVAKAEQNG